MINFTFLDRSGVRYIRGVDGDDPTAGAYEAPIPHPELSAEAVAKAKQDIIASFHAHARRKERDPRKLEAEEKEPGSGVPFPTAAETGLEGADVAPEPAKAKAKAKPDEPPA